MLYQNTKDSMLLTGTIKENLDPLDVHSDDEIWNVLEQVNIFRL